MIILFQANMGLTRLCDLNFDMNPQKWGDLMLESYRRHGDGTVPGIHGIDLT